MPKNRRRDLAKEAAWRGRIGRQADSGRSVRAWCRRHRVKEAAFHWWRRELVRRDAETGRVAFLPVQVTGPNPDGDRPPIEIVLADGRCVRVGGPVDRQVLADVLEVLEGRAC